FLSHRLVERQAELRRNGRLPWLRPDAKSQVTIRYANGRPESLDTVVLSTQHAPGIEHKKLSESVVEEVIKPVLPKSMVKGKINYLVNPTGAFEIGGPKGDCGVTGRKIIVDTYGGAAPHGGGAFSGKDPSKVDRSAAYAARYVAKNIVAAGLASKCLVQVSYARSTRRPPPTATSAARRPSSPGKQPTRRSRLNKRLRSPPQGSSPPSHPEVSMKPPFRADHVGSLLRPQDLHEARAKNRRGELSGAELKAIQDRDIREVVKMQESLGLQAITDGEFRRDWWHIDFIHGFDGVELTVNKQHTF